MWIWFLLSFLPAQHCQPWPSIITVYRDTSWISARSPCVCHILVCRWGFVQWGVPAFLHFDWTCPAHLTGGSHAPSAGVCRGWLQDRPCNSSNHCLKVLLVVRDSMLQPVLSLCSPQDWEAEQNQLSCGGVAKCCRNAILEAWYQGLCCRGCFSIRNAQDRFQRITCPGKPLPRVLLPSLGRSLFRYFEALP